MDNAQFKQQTASTFDDVAGDYDHNRFFAISAKQLAQHLPARDNLQVLDISTGTGAVAIAVAKQAPQAHITAIDLSAGMLAQAKNNAALNQIQNITFEQGDTDALPYLAGTFDVVTCGYALFFYPEMEKSYQAISRLIKPGGSFIFSSFTETAFTPYAALFLARISRDYGIEIPDGVSDRLKTETQINALADTCAHQSVKIEHCPIRYPITVNDWWALLNNAGYRGFLNQLSPEQLKTFKQDHLCEIKALSDNNTLTLNADSWFGIVEY